MDTSHEFEGEDTRVKHEMFPRKARIAHQIPGRIRLSIPSAKKNPTIFNIFETAFSTIPGIIGIKVNPETGSMIVHYDPQCETEFERQFHQLCIQNDMTVGAPGDEIEKLADAIRAEAEFLAERSRFASATVDLCRLVDREIKLLTGNTVDLEILVAGGLAVYTLVEIGPEAATPIWVTLALFSLSHLMKMQASHPTVALPVAVAASRH